MSSRKVRFTIAHIVTLLSLALLPVASAQGQDTVYSETFQSYGTQKNPAGWTDTAVGGSSAAGLYKTWPDPNGGSNIVYGTKQASGKPGITPRIGTFSTYTTKVFGSKGRFEYRGRFIRTDTDARLGLTLFSSYPETDRYYLAGLWEQPSGALTMQLFSFGAGTLTGKTDSGFTPQSGKWYQFLVQADDAGGATSIRARFWPDGTAEPTAFSIDATDASTSRLTTGRIGIWAAVKGDAYVDDLSAKSPIDHAAPTVTFVNAVTGATIDPAVTTLFKEPAKIDIKVTDDSPAPSFTATLDGSPFTTGGTVSADGAHVIAVHAVDSVGNFVDATLRLIVDSAPPLITLLANGVAFSSGQRFNKDVILTANVVDVSQVKLTSTVDGAAVTLPATITGERSNDVAVTGVDQLGWSTSVSSTIVIDKTGPKLSFTSPAANAVVGETPIEVRGAADDAVTVTVNGRSAVIDANGTFVVSVPLLEGKNDLVASAIDKTGNPGTASISVTLDTRAPNVTIAAPAGGSCTNAPSIQVRGRATDANIKSVTVAVGSATTIPATLSNDGSWTASLPLSAEGPATIVATALDTLSHTASTSVQITVDRTKPVIEVTADGTAFTGGFFNRSVVPVVTAIDADAHVVVTTTLNGVPYVAATPLTADGAYTLRASARDCAGNVSDESVIAFTIDRQPPALVTIDPAEGATIGTNQPALRGTANEDLRSASINGVDASINLRAFTGSGLTLAEGANRLTIRLVDRAGNEASVRYNVTVKSMTPSVAIVEDGSPIATDAIFARVVTPVIRANDPSATVTATLNGAAYVSGTPITSDGAYALTARAADAYGHTSPPVTAAFTIDRTPPAVKIIAPSSGAVVTSAAIEVRTTSTDAVSIGINGIAATNGIATVPLESGPNAITASAVDRAGNVATDEVIVTRDDGRPGILLTAPADNMATNRSTVAVSGQVLTPFVGGRVAVNGVETTMDPAGMFRIVEFPLHAGDNEIAVSVVGEGKPVRVHVFADFTAPTLTVLANGIELHAGDRFATPPVITFSANDDRPGVATSFTLDGGTSANALANLTNGGHSLTAIARDVAGNEARIDRTFVVGASGATGACSLSSFDPPDSSAIASNTVKMSGRFAGAAAVLVNGTRAQIEEGSFAAYVNLSQEGPNAIVIACADSNGTPAAEGQKTLTYLRLTNAPSITISTPARNEAAASDAIAVTGTVSSDVAGGDVNGIPLTPAGGSYAVANVPLAPGANIITARARNAAGRTSVATTYVVRANAPQITVTAPLPDSTTGATSLRVSGTYTDVDPATLTVSLAASVTATASTDTTGRFVAIVPIAGVTKITVSGSNSKGIPATTSVTVTSAAGLPWVTIDSPADNSYVASSATTVAVTGTVASIPGLLLQVNGTQVAIDTAYHFTAAVPVNTAVTPVVARVSTPDGKAAADVVRLIRLAGALTVKDVFPPAGTQQIDAGVLPIILFSNPIDASTARTSVRLADASGQTVSTTNFVDNDTIAIAPAIPLNAGTRYTITATTALKDASGASLSTPYDTSFTTAFVAPAIAPVLNERDMTACLTKATITGTGTASGSRITLELDGVTTSTSAAADRTFKFDFVFSGQGGFHIARVREAGVDGSLSPAASVCYRITCAGPQVVSATLDRTTKRLLIQFSKAMTPASLVASPTGSIVLGTHAGVVALNSAADTATVTYTDDLAGPLRLTVRNTVQDVGGNVMPADFTQDFAVETTQQGGGKGFITGAVYDATNGRPLSNASVTVASATGVTDEHGRYARSVDEGARTILVTAPGYTTAWRQLVVRAGAGAAPLDIRLTKRSPDQIATGSAMMLVSGGETTVTHRFESSIPSSAIAVGAHVSLTAIGAQALAGLLPLGWSPLGSADIATNAPSLSVARLAIILSSSEVAALNAASQTLSFVQYDSERDEWRVLSSVVALASDGKAVADVASSGSYAFVYADRTPAPAAPPARTGAVLQGTPDPCGATLDVCRPPSRSFDFDPKSVLPNGRTVATLITDASKPYPSGTPVQAVIDEQLNLADGRVRTDPPFTTDLLLYRSIAGGTAVAAFHLAPTSQAASETLRDGVEHVRINDFPGRVDRGSLIGAEGGKISAGDAVSIEIPTGAATEALHASAAAMPPADLSSFGTIAGFHIAAGFTLNLTRIDGSSTAVALLKPAKATINTDTTQQVIVAEVLDGTPYGTVVRLASTTQRVKATTLSTPNPQLASLPVDGIIRNGRYLVLTADAPIAFAYGQVRLGPAGPAAANALVTAIGFGVADLARPGGIFAVPVVSKPAAPFALRARSVATGDGSPVSATQSPDPDTAVAFGDLILTAQPPHIASRNPSPGATLDANAPLTIQVRFDVPLDPASGSGGITLENLTIGSAVSGTSDITGDTLSFHLTQSLQPASQYRITVYPTVRSATGAPFGLSTVWQFSTRAVPTNVSIRADLIRITLPDENGRSLLIARAGALPAGDQALAVRRNRTFAAQYQATVVTDGSATFLIGNSSDRVAFDDAIDLHVIDAVSHSTVAVIPLTPFTTADGTGFLAPIDQTTRFSSPDGFVVTVPAGAFDQPTLVTVKASTPLAFGAVPLFTQDLNYQASVSLQFQGTASKALEVELPAPSSVDPAKKYYLAMLCDSVRGPRMMIVDTLRLDHGRFTTAPATGAAGATLAILRVPRRGAPQSLISSMDEAKKFLLRVLQSGVYASVDVRPPISWAMFDGVTERVDIFWDKLASLFASVMYVMAKAGEILVPVIASQSFEVVGIDATTGLESFKKVYDPQPPGDPVNVISLPAPIDDKVGPYPVFASPARVELFDLQVAGVTLTSAKNLEVKLDAGMVVVSSSATPLPPGSRVEVLNTRTALLDSRDDFGAGTQIKVPAAVGDRIVVLIAGKNASPSAPIAVVFNKPIFLGLTTGDAVDDFVHASELFRVLSRDEGSTAPWTDVTKQAIFHADSGDRRIFVTFDHPLQLGKQYRLVLNHKEIGDTLGGSGTVKLHLAALPVAGATPPAKTENLLSDDLHLDFTTRTPGGRIGTFDLLKGGVRDLALNGNIALVSALGGGLQAFDISDPAALDAKFNPQPLATVLPGVTQFWAVTSDRHGRVYATGTGDTFGVLRSYRLSDFVTPQPNPDASSPFKNIVTRQISEASVSWVPGANTTVSSGGFTTLGDRPEGIPRKLQLALQDQEEKYNAASLSAAFSGTVTPIGGGFVKLTIIVNGDPKNDYATQRVTVENRALDLRWSADVDQKGSAPIAGIIARPEDELTLVRNRTTYGIISLFGAGIAVYDLNAIESNDRDPSSLRPLRELIASSDGSDPSGTAACDPASSAATGTPCPLRDIAFSPEGLLQGTATNMLRAYALDSNHGMLDLNVTPETGSFIANAKVKPAGPGLNLTTSYAGPAGRAFLDHPRLASIRSAFLKPPFGLQPSVRFTSTSPYRNYALIAANQFGLLVVKLDGGALDWQSLVDVIWVPAGAYSVRAIADSDLAVVVDGAGRVLVIDLKKIDESDRVPTLPACTSPICTAPLFPTAANALASKTAPMPAGADWVEFGADDPRIIWKSKPHLVSGTLPPLVDPSTGFVFTGDVNSTRMNVVAATDPKISIVVNTGSGFHDVSGIVPLGIDPPSGIVSGPEGSLAAFRVEMDLPGSIADSISGKLKVALESERIAGAATYQTPDGYPRSHLRLRTRTGTVDPRAPSNFTMERLLPIASGDPALVRLRYQRGYNRFSSPWIVAVSDLRASEFYDWGSTPALAKTQLGCATCERPASLKLKKEADGVFELYTNGPLVTIHPEMLTVTTSVFSGTPYEYLNGRLESHITTVRADTIRPTPVVLAGRNAPVVFGAMQETYYAHSGEMETGTVDLIAGGRAGLNVAFDRTYRSRTLGATVLGAGWDSTMFRRLRELPNKSVEYRDGVGNVWLFTPIDEEKYEPPVGFYLKLARARDRWTLTDQAWNITTFDSAGRITMISDRLVGNDPTTTGNVIRYFYNAQGELSAIADPLNRLTFLRYWTDDDVGTAGAYAGLLRQITDWRGRKIDFNYNGSGLLTKVFLPEFANASSLGAAYSFTGPRRPFLEYVYDSAAGTFNDRIELATNLVSIKDPVEALKSSGTPRVAFEYDTSHRDRIKSERTPLPECTAGGTCGVVGFTYPSDLRMLVRDLLGQFRLFEVSDGLTADKRQHLIEITEQGASVLKLTAAEMKTRDKARVDEEMETVDLVTKYKYEDHGEITETTHPNGLVTTASYDDRLGGKQKVIANVEHKAGAGVLSAKFDYDKSDVRNSNIVNAATYTDSGGTAPVVRPQPIPRIDKLETTVVDDDRETKTVHNAAGQVETVTRSAPGGAGAQTSKVAYNDASSANLYERGKAFTATAGGSNLTFKHEAANTAGDLESGQDEHGLNEEEHDAYGRLIARKIKDPKKAVLTDEAFGYDAEGRVILHTRKQAGVGVVTETSNYDVLGRLLETVTDNAQVNGAPSSIHARRSYDVANRRVIEFDPSTSSTTVSTDTTTDFLGRVISVNHSDGTVRTHQRFAYDRTGAQVYETDEKRLATLHGMDTFGREVFTVRSDGTRDEQAFDAAGQLLFRKSRAAIDPSKPAGTAPEPVSSTHFVYSKLGRQRGTSVQVSSALVFRATRAGLSPNGLTEISRVGSISAPADELASATRLRTTRTLRDDQGRVVEKRFGEAPFLTMADADTFSMMKVTSFVGGTPQTVENSEPRGSGVYRSTTTFDALGRVIELCEAGCAYKSTTSYDEAGNILKSKPAGYDDFNRAYDSRGLLVQEDAPAGKTTHREYDARGTLRRYVDEAGKQTIYETDALGRATKTMYVDGTTEEIVYENETGAVASKKDRKGQWLSYFYDAGGRITDVRLGGPRSIDPKTTPTGDPYLRYKYDLGGRLTEVASRDGAVQYEEYDMLGRPGITRAIRYAKRSGFAATPEVSDAHTQRHLWTIFDGERERWRMPAAGASLPATEPSSPWRSWIVENRDAGGNITLLAAADGLTAAPGPSILKGTGRGVGRIAARQRFYGIAGNAYDENYGYADGTTAPGPSSGLLGAAATMSGTFKFAGSIIERDAAKRAAIATDLGMPERTSDWSYDARGRLTTSLLVHPPESKPVVADTLVHADFRQARTVTLDADDAKELGSAVIGVAPPDWTATKSDAHQYLSRTLSSEPAPRVYAFEAGRRTADGVWNEEYDEEGRLVAITRNTERVEYVYNPLGRVVGRRALMKDAANWIPETRASILAADDLPAETTWLWDPIVDRLLVVAEAGKSIGSSVKPDAGFARQYVHGDQGYDDLVEVTTPAGRFVTLIDEAGTGSMHAVIKSSGKLAERVLYADSYGDAPRYITGPVVDQIELKFHKDGAGNVDKAEFRVRVTEAIDPATVAGGGRIASLNASNAVVFTSPVAPTLEKSNQLLWTLDATAWKALQSPTGAVQIEVAVSNTLRAALWDGPVMPTPAWMLDDPDRASTTAFPVIQRRSLAAITALIAAITPNNEDTDKAYAIRSVYLVASPTSTTRLFTGFKASPFIDPRSGFAYFRARWYDAGVGGWLTPDPVGYRDSSNLYAYCAEDPVNCSDARGLESFTPDERKVMQQRVREEMAMCEKDPLSDVCVGFMGLVLGDADPLEVGAGTALNFFVNGIIDTPQMAAETGATLSKRYGSSVDRVYNPTGSNSKMFGALIDSIQTLAVNIPGFEDRTMLMVARQLRSHVKALNKGQALRAVAHSQGTPLLVGATTFLTEEERSHIDLVTYAEVIRAYPSGFHSVTRHKNLADPITDLLGGILPSVVDATFRGHNVNYYFFIHGFLNHPLDEYLAAEDAGIYLSIGPEHRRVQQMKDTPLTWIDRHR